MMLTSAYAPRKSPHLVRSACSVQGVQLRGELGAHLKLYNETGPVLQLRIAQVVVREWCSCNPQI